MSSDVDVQVLASLLREGLDILALHKDCFEEERRWRARVVSALAHLDERPSLSTWRTVGCNCGKTVRELPDGSRLDYYQDTPHHCAHTSSVRRQRAIDEAVERLLQRAYREATSGRSQ